MCSCAGKALFTSVLLCQLGNLGRKTQARRRYSSHTNLLKKGDARLSKAKCKGKKSWKYYLFRQQTSTDYCKKLLHFWCLRFEICQIFVSQKGYALVLSRAKCKGKKSWKYYLFKQQTSTDYCTKLLHFWSLRFVIWQNIISRVNLIIFVTWPKFVKLFCEVPHC